MQSLKLALVAFVALTVVLVIGGLVALREYLRPTAKLPCDLDLTTVVGRYEPDSTIRLRDHTPFEWRTVHVFQAYESSKDVRDRTGHPYVGDRWGEIVPRCTTLFVFRLGEDETCEASLDRSKGRNLVAEASSEAHDPSFVVRREGDDDASPTATSPGTGSRPKRRCS